MTDTELNGGDETETGANVATRPWYRTWHGITVIGVYAILTIGAALVTTGWLVGQGEFFTGDPTGSQVPGFVYVFAFLGAMAYAFTSVVAKLDPEAEAFDRGTTALLRVGLRAMAALPLAAGVYLLWNNMGFAVSGSNSQAVAGVAFLVGLYVNVTLKALGGVAERVLGRTAKSTDESSHAEPSEPSR
ncbi:MAG TPA: hypothetical protein VKA37_11090, partial [Halobacteriales archaeon]|nr:hypothetical protein [Halobacteriales archaeon]